MEQLPSPHHHKHYTFPHNTPLPSPNSSSSSSSNNCIHSPGPSPSPSPSPTSNNPPTVTRSDPSNPYPTTFVQADTSSFKQVVQMLTGSSIPKSNPIPPIKPSNKSRPSTKLYERRSNSRISPLLPTPAGHSVHSPRYHNNTTPIGMLSPSMLDFPALMLSPVTPLIHDPFNRSPVDKVAEEKAIAEKGFFLHPVSPVSVTEPRLLPLFPVTSPKVSSSSDYHHNHRH